MLDRLAGGSFCTILKPRITKIYTTRAVNKVEKNLFFSSCKLHTSVKLNYSHVWQGTATGLQAPPSLGKMGKDGQGKFSDFGILPRGPPLSNLCCSVPCVRLPQQLSLSIAAWTCTSRRSTSKPSGAKIENFGEHESRNYAWVCVHVCVNTAYTSFKRCKYGCMDKYPIWSFLAESRPFRSDMHTSTAANLYPWRMPSWHCPIHDSVHPESIQETSSTKVR